MRVSRIYQPVSLKENQIINLTPDAINHVARVLRLSVGAKIILFNGEGGEFLGTISDIQKKTTTVKIEKFQSCNTESSLPIHLAQGISRGEKMDLVIQKAVELGVQQITPLITQRCGVQLSEERREKRWEHWCAVAIAACEQCGRDKLPLIHHPVTLPVFLAEKQNALKIILHPAAQTRLPEIPKDSFTQGVTLLIGPEGGWDNNEINLANKNDFTNVRLGYRVLRTETAAIAAISALQLYAGDF